MVDRRPPDDSMDPEERRQLDELEQQLTIEDPALVHSLRTGRPEKKRVDPVQAAVVACIATPIVLLIFLFAGRAAGTIAVAVTLIVVVVRLLTTKRGSSDGPSAYR
jgi:hypothetical protein